MAATYDEILKALQARFEELTGMEADRASDIGIRLKLLAGQLTGMETRGDYILKQSFPQTAGGEYLEMHARARGLERKQPLNAAGTLMFSRSLPSENDIIIPQGTVCTTGTAEDIRFVTTCAATLAAGELSVKVGAGGEGRSGGQCRGRGGAHYGNPAPRDGKRCKPGALSRWG